MAQQGGPMDVSKITPTPNCQECGQNTPIISVSVANTNFVLCKTCRDNLVVLLQK